ncbi:MAG: exo-alpha-sialidase [Gaiellales bacterium]
MHRPSRPTVLAAATVVLGLVIGGLSWSAAQGDPPMPKAAPGSLPLTGDQLVSGDGGSPAEYKTGFASQWNVLNWAPGEIAAVVSSFSMNGVDDNGRTVKRILIGSQFNADVGAADAQNRMSYSDNSGKSFLTTDPRSATSALNVTRLRNGSLLAIDFLPGWADEAHTKWFVNVFVSNDNGKTWDHREAPTTFPVDKVPGFSTWGGFRVHKRILRLNDGTLIVPGYTAFGGRGVSIVMQSTDDGATWSFRSQIPNTDSPGTNEVGWAHTSDGRLTAVLRSTDAPEQHLMQSFSDNDGMTWTEAKDIIGPDGEIVRGIYPDLNLQPNGTMLLLTGRRDVRVLANYDGTARTWDTANTIFANFPSTGNNGRYDGSSGNSSMENIGASRSVVFFDQCHTWGCGAYNQQFGISAKYAAVVTPGAGRIDVMTKLLDGTAKLTGNFAVAIPRFPEQRKEGAFDGSSDTWAETVLQGRPGRAGSMTLTLDKAYQLNKIGLMLGHGEVAESGTVEVSADGSTWTTVVDEQDTRDRAMRYTEFASTTAKYVRVTGGVNARTTVTELELYAADVDTFENEVPFSVPRGWTDANASWTTDVPKDAAYSDIGGHHSATALRLWDKWTDQNARINRPSAPTDHQVANLQWAPSDVRARFVFGALGQAEDGSTEKAWQFRITPGSPATQPPTVEAFDGTAWVALGKLSGRLTMSQYLPVTIDTTATAATIKIGDTSFTTTVKAAASVKQTGLHFSTSDPSEYGGIYYIDDVTVRG